MTLPSNTIGADNLLIYPEITPAGVDYIIDYVSLTEVNSGDNWEDDVEANIDALRKKNVKINFIGVEQSEIDDLTLDIEQVTHNYPFGHAVQAAAISECESSGTDNYYCKHVKDNYNWIVDTYK